MSRRIPLTQGQFAIVDDGDFELLSRWKWYAQRHPTTGFYAARREGRGGPVVLMHRFINQTPDGFVTDHRDCNGLNNQRLNLRTATDQQNQMNTAPNRGGTSPLKGAWFDPSMRNRKQWRSAIRINGRLKYLGRFQTEHEAADAYAVAAAEHFGDFARTTRGATP